MEGESQRWRSQSNWCTISQLRSAGVGFDLWFWQILWPMPCALMLSTYLLFTDLQVFGFHNCCIQVTSPCHSCSQHAMRKSMHPGENMSSGHRLGLNPSCVKVQVAQLCLTFCDLVAYTVHGILQARILGWVAFPFSRESSQTRDWTRVSHIAGRFFTSWATREAPKYRSGLTIPSPADLPDSGIEPGSPALQVDSLPTELWGKPPSCVTQSKLFILFFCKVRKIKTLNSNGCCCFCCSVTSVVSNFVHVQPYGLQPARLLCPWDFLGKSSGVCCHALLWGIFPTQVSNLGLLHCRQIFYHWVTREAPSNGCYENQMRPCMYWHTQHKQ